jgi:hypothetical protein
VWIKFALDSFDFSQPLDAQDRLIAETSPDGIAWDRRPSVIVGSNSGFERWVIDLSQLEGRATGGLRFHLITNASGIDQGVALDDLEIYCVPPATQYTGAWDEFVFDWGTSMAAPHVSGVAVLLLSLNLQLSAAELKQRILQSVDPLPSLAGKTVTGGRLDAARALGPAPSAPPPPPAAPPPAAPPVAGHPANAGPPSPSPSSALRTDIRWLASELRNHGLHAVLRAGGFRADRLHALAPGRFTLAVSTTDGRAIANGSRAADRPVICSLTARLTRRGLALLRTARRLRLTLALTFAPRDGRPIVQRVPVRLTR